MKTQHTHNGAEQNTTDQQQTQHSHQTSNYHNTKQTNNNKHTTTQLQHRLLLNNTKQSTNAHTQLQAFTSTNKQRNKQKFAGAAPRTPLKDFD
jgi:hypothetical protein